MTSQDDESGGVSLVDLQDSPEALNKNQLQATPRLAEMAVTIQEKTNEIGELKETVR